MTTIFESRATQGAYPTTWAEARAVAVLPVWSTEKPNLGGLLGLGRDAAYRAQRERKVPTVWVGGRVYIPTTPLRRMLGDLPAEGGPFEYTPAEGDLTP